MPARTALRFPLATLLFLAGAAHAQIFRAYLASDGSDANPCTLAQPCRLLPAALTAVAGGGEIWMLDSANYNTGTVTIGKSVSIVAVPGVVGSIVALNGGAAISITAAGLKIALRNVAIGPVAGATPGTHGVHMTGAATSLSIEKSVIAGLPQIGVAVDGTGTVNVYDSTVRNNNYGFYLQAGAQATIASSRLADNGVAGVFAHANVAGTTTAAGISDSVISGNPYAVNAAASAVANARISVTRSTIERAQDALRAETSGVGTARIYFGGGMVIDSLNAWYVSGTGATFYSMGNNQMQLISSFGPKTVLFQE
jgi:hypothetical protein